MELTCERWSCSCPQLAAVLPKSCILFALVSRDEQEQEERQMRSVEGASDAVEICKSDLVATPTLTTGGRNGRWKDSELQEVSEPLL